MWQAGRTDPLVFGSFPSSPGLGDVLGVSSAQLFQLDVSGAVDFGPIGVTNGQEVGPQAPNHVFGQVRQRLADGGPKKEGPHDLVEGSQVIVELRPRVEPLLVDQVGLSRRNLQIE